MFLWALWTKIFLVGDHVLAMNLPYSLFQWLRSHYIDAMLIAIHPLLSMMTSTTYYICSSSFFFKLHGLGSNLKREPKSTMISKSCTTNRCDSVFANWILISSGRTFGCAR
jgi:hypothetical protein